MFYGVRSEFVTDKILPAWNLLARFMTYSLRGRTTGTGWGSLLARVMTIRRV